MHPEFADGLGGGRSGLSAVTARAALDAGFRAQLLQDPHRAIRETFGVEIPRTLRLRFVEKPAGVDLMVVLPDLLGDPRFTPDQMEEVSGGIDHLLLARGSWSAARPQPTP